MMPRNWHSLFSIRQQLRPSHEARRVDGGSEPKAEPPPLPAAGEVCIEHDRGRRAAAADLFHLGAAMSESRWVQHQSGQGEKWKVLDEEENEHCFLAESPIASLYYWALPKSEYRLCEPPERWIDVKPENICELKQLCSDLRKTVVTLETVLSGLAR
jgi:hypothetical protein